MAVHVAAWVITTDQKVVHTLNVEYQSPLALNFVSVLAARAVVIHNAAESVDTLAGWFVKATALRLLVQLADAADAFTGSHTERCVRERLQRVGENSAQLGALQALSRAAEARLASAVAAHAALVAMAKLGGQEACKLRLSDEGTSVCVDVKNPSAHALSRAWSLVALVSSEVPLGDSVDETEATRLHARDSAVAAIEDQLSTCVTGDIADCGIALAAAAAASTSTTIPIMLRPGSSKTG